MHLPFTSSLNFISCRFRQRQTSEQRSKCWLYFAYDYLGYYHFFFFRESKVTFFSLWWIYKKYMLIERSFWLNSYDVMTACFGKSAIKCNYTCWSRTRWKQIFIYARSFHLFIYKKMDMDVIKWLQLTPPIIYVLNAYEFFNTIEAILKIS